MECNKDGAVRAREIAVKMENDDFEGARKIAQKAQQLFPELDNIYQLLTVCDVHCSARKKICGSEMDWYGILQVERLADEVTIKKQYQKLALVLHPDKNKFPGAESAYKLIREANMVLSDQGKRSLYDSKCRISMRTTATMPPPHQFNRNPSDRKQYIPTPPNPSNARQAFWTSCPFCNMRYQYYRDFVNKALCCLNCSKPFIAYDLGAQGLVAECKTEEVAVEEEMDPTLRPAALTRKDRRGKRASSGEVGGQSKRLRAGQTVGTGPSERRAPQDLVVPAGDGARASAEVQPPAQVSVASPEGTMIGAAPVERWSVFSEKFSGQGVLEKVLTQNDKVVLGTLSVKDSADRYFQHGFQSLAYGYNAHLKMKEYFKAWKTVDRRLQQRTGDLERAREEIGEQKLEISKLREERDQAAEALRLSSEARRSTMEELREAKGTVAQLEAKLSISEKARVWERTLGVAALKETGEFRRIVQDKIDEHMRSEDVQCEIAKYWDQGYKAFRIQAQAMWPYMDFTLIQPNEIEETQAEGGGDNEGSEQADSVTQEVGEALVDQGVSVDPTGGQEVEKPQEERASDGRGRGRAALDRRNRG